MSLQDIAPINPNAFLNPQTGQPYAYGSPEYQAAILPFLENQLQNQAHRASNSRGMFYSGPAMADEQQAAAELAGNIAQQGAQQTASQAQILQQEQFQAQQQAAQNQASADLARKQGNAQMQSSAIGGGLQSLGTIGGLYGAEKLGLFGPRGTPAVSPDVGGQTLSSGGPEDLTEIYSGAGSRVPASGGTTTTGADLADTVNAQAAAPDAYSGGMYADPASDFGAMSSSATPAVGSGASMMLPSMSTFGGLGGIAAGAASALPAAILGSEAAGRTFGNSTEQKVGSGLGGLLGGAGGLALGGPAGAALGAGAGSFLGNQYGEHPGLALLGPAGLPMMIPGVSHALQPIGNAFNSAGNSISHFLGGLF